MNISREKKKEEALIRMKVIAEHFNLGDKLINYLKDDKLYYSYAYSMDTINYDERYVKIVQDFERQKNAYVYHVVEAKTQDGYRWFTKSEFGGENVWMAIPFLHLRYVLRIQSIVHLVNLVGFLWIRLWDI